MLTALVHGHDCDWAPEDATCDRGHLPWGDPISVVESAVPDLYERAVALPDGRYIACAPRKDIVAWYLGGIDPGRCSVRRDLLAALDAARSGTHAERDAALDALLADVRD